MNKLYKFTFKNEPAKWLRSQRVTIKYNKIEVGIIYAEGNTWYAQLQIMKTETLTDGNPNCPWLWGTIVNKPTLDEVKKWLNDNRETIFEKYTLHLQDLLNCAENKIIDEVESGYADENYI